LAQFHLVIWRNFIWLFGAISFGYLAQFHYHSSLFITLVYFFPIEEQTDSYKTAI